MKKLKVYGGYHMVYIDGKRKQMNVVVAVYTKKQAMEMLECNYKYFTDCFCETYNVRSLATATEVGMWAIDDANHDIEPVRIK